MANGNLIFNLKTYFTTEDASCTGEICNLVEKNKLIFHYRTGVRVGCKRKGRRGREVSQNSLP